MLAILNKLEHGFDAQDLGKLILRVSFALMMLLHGVHKIYSGTGYIDSLLAQHSLPGFISYGVYIGEIIAPLMVAAGIYTRTASAVVIGTCLVIVGLAHMEHIFALNKYGAWALEGVGTYLFAAIAVLLLGSGKYAVKPS